MEFVGYLAGTLTLVTYLPQTIKTIKTRKTRDLSLPTYVLLSASAILWVIYGINNSMPAIYATNSVVAALSLVILVIKLKESNEPGSY